MTGFNQRLLIQPARLSGYQDEREGPGTANGQSSMDIDVAVDIVFIGGPI